MKNVPKILSPNSPLKMMPVEMVKRELHLFDSIRFLLEDIEYSFQNLYKDLTDVSVNGINMHPQFLIVLVL